MLRRHAAGGARRADDAVPGGARVLPAHLESNFINPDYRGAQPLECLRLPASPRSAPTREADGVSWGGQDILDEIAAARPDVGIVTMAPELPDALDLIRDLTAHGHHVSLGHSGATYEEALEGVRAGARHATHLVQSHEADDPPRPGTDGRRPGVGRNHRRAGVRLRARAPAVMRVALAAKRPERVMAITDGTAGSGLPTGGRSAHRRAPHHNSATPRTWTTARWRAAC